MSYDFPVNAMLQVSPSERAADNSGAANTPYGDHAPQRKEATPEEIISRNNRLAAELRKCESEITDEDDPRPEAQV